MLENIENMLNAIGGGDFESAEEAFQYVMTQKVADRLDNLKQEVGGSFMNNQGSEE